MQFSMIGITASSPRQEATHILAVPATIGNVSQDRTNIVRPGRPLKLDSSSSSYCSRHVGIYRILVADDIWISVLYQSIAASKEA